MYIYKIHKGPYVYDVHTEKGMYTCGGRGVS